MRMSGVLQALARARPSSRTRTHRLPSMPPRLPVLVELVVLTALAEATTDRRAQIVPLAAILLRAFRAEPRRLAPAPLDRVRSLLTDLSLAALLAAPLVGSEVRASYGRTWALVVLGLAAARVAANVSMRLMRGRGWVYEQVLLAGDRRHVGDFGRLLDAHPEYGLRPVLGESGVVAHDLAVEAAAVGATRVIVVEHDLDRETVRRLLLGWPASGASLHLVVDDHVLLSAGSQRADDIWGNTVVAAPIPHDQRPAWTAKRIVERVAAAIVLVLVTPALAALALGVRLSSPGPILFRQVRIGRGGKPFTMLKFRSLPVDHVDSGWNAGEAVKPSPFGRLLRLSGLDELPQLVNVLRGEMALIGPRPELPHYVEEFTRTVPGYEHRHRVPVGVTGWAQAHGLRGETSIEERVRFDNMYIDRWTATMELLVLVRTVRQLLRFGSRTVPPAPEEHVIDLRDGVAPTPPMSAAVQDMELMS